MNDVISSGVMLEADPVPGMLALGAPHRSRAPPMQVEGRQVEIVADLRQLPGERTRAEPRSIQLVDGLGFPAAQGEGRITGDAALALRALPPRSKFRRTLPRTVKATSSRLFTRTCPIRPRAMSGRVYRPLLAAVHITSDAPTHCGQRGHTVVARPALILTDRDSGPSVLDPQTRD
jgi:hypothetical protein